MPLAAPVEYVIKRILCEDARIWSHLWYRLDN